MLEAGTRLGPYEILGPLGAGGMGEVYRARDTRLLRDVAVKVLPEHLSANPDVRARFDREAKAVSSLNHPNICTLHDVGHEGGVDFLVMELVDGETLAARLEKGPLPVPELLRVASQVAEALDRAHKSGIVHRDLKPGNVMLTKSGAKLMDFGLARSGPSAAAPGSLTNSPTLTTPLTSQGQIVGTFQYMAPEQLEGQEADTRTDIFALGVTMYEMATGRRAFEGKTQASLIASILKEEPRPVSEIMPVSPPGLDRLVKACIAKDPEERIQTAHDVKLQLQWLAEGGSQAGVPAPVAARRRGRERGAWIAAGVAAVLAMAAGTGWFLSARRQPPVLRFSVGAAPGMRSISWPRISPDGTTLAFNAVDSSGQMSIWIRPLNSLTAVPVPGTQGSSRPFWSPDSRNLAFVANGELKRVAVAGGPPVLVCQTSGSDGSWGRDGTILLDAGESDSISSVPAGGGTLSPASFPDRAHGETGHAWPYFLPDGKHFLFMSFSGDATKDRMLHVGLLGSRETRELGQVGSLAQYADPGYLLYVSDGALVARPFDVGGMKWKGAPIPLADHIPVQSNQMADFSCSANGTLVYLGQASAQKGELVWLDRSGHELSKVGAPAAYSDIALAPDETRVAFGLLDDAGLEGIWVRDLTRGAVSRLTFESTACAWPHWSPDGRRIAYTCSVKGSYDIRSRAADGGGGVDTVVAIPGKTLGPTDWARDGTTVIYAGLEHGWDVGWVSTREHKIHPLVASPANERMGRISPDGKWLAYMSAESRRPEVYIRPFGSEGGKWQVSTEGGAMPVWRPDGREVYYRNPLGDLMAVSVAEAGPGAVQLGVPARLFNFTANAAGYTDQRYAVSKDGSRFLVNRSLSAELHSAFTVVMNWPLELKKR